MSQWEEFSGVRLGKTYYEIEPPEPGELIGLVPIDVHDVMAIIAILEDGTAVAGPGEIYDSQLRLAERWWRERSAST